MEIPIWAARSSGPVTHFWFEHEGSVRRVCDGTLREERCAPESSDVFVPCGRCKGIYLEDVLYGGRALALDTAPGMLENVVRTQENMVRTQESRVHAQEDRVEESDLIVPRISMASFARFYESRPASQVSIVRDLRIRQANPKQYLRRDFYGLLRHTLRATHWGTGGIHTFEDALGPAVDRLEDARKKDPYRLLGRAYIDFWTAKGAEFFEVPAIHVEIGGLPIVVAPEAGMRVGYDSQVLKLWFNTLKPSRLARQILHHLMERARSSSAQWSNTWNIGVLDIRRQEIPPPIRESKDFELGVDGQVAAFLQIWERLDRQAKDAAP